MKILAINGSHHGKRGFNYFLLSKICNGAKSKGADCQIINLISKKINYCHACDVCKKPKTYLKCIYSEKDDVYKIFELMRQSDIHIFSSPIYVFNISTVMKSFFERLYGISDVYKLELTESGFIFHHIDQTVVKPFLSIVTCDSLENIIPQAATDFFSIYSKVMNAPQLGHIERRGGLISGYGKLPEKFEQFPKLNKIFGAFEEIGKYLATKQKIPRHIIKTAGSEFIPVPFFNLLKRLKPFKKIILQKAKEFMKKK